MLTATRVPSYELGLIDPNDYWMTGRPAGLPGTTTLMLKGLGEPGTGAAVGLFILGLAVETLILGGIGFAIGRVTKKCGRYRKDWSTGQYRKVHTR